MAKAGIVYAGTDDGVVIFSDPASIGRWRRIGHELVGLPVRALVSHSALVIDAATASAGVHHSDDGGQSWRQTSGADVVAVAAHPAAPATVVLATSAGELQRSDDGGANWRMLSRSQLPAGDIAQMLIDPHTPEQVVVALRGGNVWASDNDGETWNMRSVGLPGGLDTLTASPGRAGRLFATVDGDMWRTSDSLQWIQATGKPPALLGGIIAVLPGKTEVLLATTLDSHGTAGLARSDDDGDTWQVATTDTTLEAAITVIIPAAYHLDTAWAGTSDGQLLLSDDRGRSWHTVARDLAPIRALAAVRLA